MTHTRDVDSPLVTFPPDVVAGTGRIERHLAPYGVVADLDLTVCHACRLAVIEHVRTDLVHRRRGYGRELVTAAVGHGPGYDWSTTCVDTDAAAAFWSAVAPDLPHQPTYCEHMRRAWEARSSH